MSGLVPINDASYDEKKKLKIGQVYEVTIKLVRNYDFHKKYFALINCAWEFMTEKQQAFFKDRLPKIQKGYYAVCVLAAVYDPYYESICRGHGYDVRK